MDPCEDRFYVIQYDMISPANQAVIYQADPDKHVDSGGEINGCPADAVDIITPTHYLPLVIKAGP